VAHSEALRSAPGMERIAGTVVVLALHGAALYALMSHRIIPVPDEVVTLFVETVTLRPPPPPQAPKPQPQPEKRRLPEPPPRQLVAQAPIVSAAEPVALPSPMPEPAVEAPPARPAGPVTLSDELSVACPERRPPAYPPLSRRLNEEGKVLLRVELDEHGSVSSARVETSSGFPRLDEAALAAVRTWRCTPARRDGRAVRAVAMQPFRFVLQ